MLTKTKLALAAALLAVTSTASLAAQHKLHSAPVRLQSGVEQSSGQQYPVEIDQTDRTSSPYAGGVG
jgi:hypothetical protein